jgi:quercetin 2,3-dioxygenase
MTVRQLERVIPAMAASDGAGVKLRRSLGANPALRLDPFLMLDEFASDAAADYIAGFPAHPHRGFETVTYMLEGHMLHQDHLGNTGHLRAGDVQWMTAASGIIHSEMPQQDHGRMHGFQLWLNLPAAEKMKPAAYRDIAAAQIPSASLTSGGDVRVIAGSFAPANAAPVHGPINGPDAGISTDPLYFDVSLPPDAPFAHGVRSGHNAFLYVFDGELLLGQGATLRKIGAQHAGLLSDGDAVQVRAGADGARFLLLAAKPLREPVVQYGPFVMNTREEIEQALADYRDGTFGRVTN